MLDTPSLSPAALIEEYPALHEVLSGEAVREGLKLAKCAGGIQILTLRGEPMFFRFKDEGAYLPHLKLLHRCACNLSSRAISPRPITSAQPHTQSVCIQYFIFQSSTRC